MFEGHIVQTALGLGTCCIFAREVSDGPESCLPFGAPVDPGSMIVDDGSPLEIICYSDFEGIFGPWP